MKRRLFYGIALAPGLAGIVIGLLLEISLLPNSVFVFRLQTGASLSIAVVGLAFSGLGLLAMLLWRRWQSEVQLAASRERRAQVEAHRRFIRRLNHEIKNHLTAMRSGLANLNRDAGDDAASGTSLTNVIRQVERLGRLTNDLRKLADIEAGEAEMAPVDLTEVTGEAIEMARSARGPNGQTVAINIQKLPWPLSPAVGDRDLLLLAIYNLLDNALKFSGPDATIEVRGREDGLRATIEVADSGCGIAPDDLPHVTEELFRGQQTQGIEGSGLGLALVEWIAALHGGKLAIRSREGQGTIATLSLPLWRK